MSAKPHKLKIHAAPTPAALGSNSSESNASIAAMMSPYAAECAKAAGRSGDTTPGTRNAKPMNRKLCRISRGRNASARCRERSSGQIYRAVTIPHAMKLNAMLTKNQIICCGTMNISLLEFQPLTATGDGDRGLVACPHHRLGGVGDGVLAPPDLGVGRELRFLRERTAQFAVVSVQIEAWAERGQHEPRKLAKPVAEGPLVAERRRITTSDRLEVFGGAASHIEHIGRWCAQLERAALVIVNVVANATEHVDRIAAHSRGLHEQPSWCRHELDWPPDGPADRPGHVLRA